MGQVCSLYTEVGLVFSQSLFERTVHEVVDELIKVQTQLWTAHTLIEGTDSLIDIDAEETHVTVLHQVLQLVFIAFDGLVLQSDTRLVAFVLEIEITFLGNVADGEGDEEEFALFIIDRVEAHLCVAVHTSFDNHTLRTEVEILGLTVIEHFSERGHVVDRAVEIIRVMLSLEVQDLAHFLVGSNQLAFFVVESQSHQTLVEDFPIAVSHLQLLLFAKDTFCFVCQCTEEISWNLQGRIAVFCNADIAHPVPLSFVRLHTPVPADEAF